jgi:hypothetical protein
MGRFLPLSVFKTHPAEIQFYYALIFLLLQAACFLKGFEQHAQSIVASFISLLYGGEILQMYLIFC